MCRRLRAATFTRNIRPLDVRAQNLRPAKIMSHRLLHRIQRRRDALARIGHHGGRHRRRAAGEMKFSDLRQGLDAGFHRVVAQRAVQVQVDEARGDKSAGGVDDGRVFGPQNLRGWGDLFDRAAVDDHAVSIEDCPRPNHASVDDDYHGHAL